MIESKLVAERNEFLTANPRNDGNCYYFGSAYDNGRK